MKLRSHLRSLRWHALVGVCAWLSGGALHAVTPGENRAYAAAEKAFQDGIWQRAETEFAEFVEKHPESERVPDAVLLQAQAQFKQRKFNQAVSLLSARQANAGKRADEYLFWIGEAQLQSTNYVAAVAAFAQLTRECPTSPRRLEASVGEAAARAKLGEWPRVVELLQKPGNAFQHMAGSSTNHAYVAQGYLLLAEAGLIQKDYDHAEAALQALAQRPLSTELKWQRQYLLCRIQEAAGRTEDAQQTAAGLLSFAESTGRRDLLATSVALQARLLEQLGRRDEAIAAFKRNLAPGTPVERQRQALLKVAELTAAQSRLSEAIETLQQFLTQFSNAPAADLALLTLGELHLKQHVAPGQTNATSPATNHLQLALEYFDQLINTFSNSTLTGKAELGRGWGFWLEGRLPESLGAFKRATEQLPPSEDLAVARFKLADAQFAQNDFAGALQSYQGALAAAADFPRVKDALTLQALYQMLRTSLNATNLAAATDAMGRILQSYPESPVTDRSVLLVGQGLADLGEPDKARAQFARFVELFPESPLRPAVELAIARTYEQKAEWSAAITSYDAWLGRFTNSPLRPRAKFNRAWSNDQAGDETNALTLFTNFVAQFPTHELAPQAQWWVADRYFVHGDFPNAEKNYKLLFQNWPGSELAYAARLMAGRAAVGRLDYPAAIDHFTNLTINPNCPPDLKVQATFAYGGALMLLDARDANRVANLELAIQVFGTIRSSNPTNEQSALALGEIGKCYFQLAAQNPLYYESASNAYQQVIDSPYAEIAARSQAQIGLALTLEAQAQPLTGEEQSALLKLALGKCLDVVYEKNLREGETPDARWLKKAGLEAARLIEAMQEWPQAINLYRRLGDLLPPLKESLERKIQKAQEHLTPGKT